MNETELLAGGSIEALKGAIAKVSALAPTAIASLKSAVLNLFTGSNDDGTDNQPSPAQSQSQSMNRSMVSYASFPRLGITHRRMQHM